MSKCFHGHALAWLGVAVPSFMVMTVSQILAQTALPPVIVEGSDRRAAPAQSASQPGDSSQTANEAGAGGQESPQAPQFGAATQGTATKFDVPILEVPQSVQVITAEELVARGPTSLGQALSTVPTAIVGSGRAAAFPDFSYRIRGEATRILRDGVRHRYWEGVDPNSLVNIERIEVLKGPASTGYGFGAFGGLINIVTKVPQATPSFEFQGVVGNYDRLQGSIDATGPLTADGKVRYRVTAEGEDTDLWQDFMFLKRYGASLALDADVTKDFRVGFRAEYQERTLPRYPGVPLVNRGDGLAGSIASVDRGIFLSDPNVRDTRSWGDIVRINAEYDFASGWTVHLVGQTSGFNTQFGQISTGLADAAGNITRTYRQGNEFDRDYNLNAYVTGAFDTFGLGHKIAFGTDNSLFRGSFYQFGGNAATGGVLSTPFNIFSPTYGIAIPRNSQLGKTFVQPDQKFDQTGFYLQDQIALTKQLKLLGGVRYDTVSYDATRDGVKQIADFENTSYSIGATYEFVAGWSVFAGYGTGFDPDNIRASRDVAGQLFEPEKSWQAEAGIKVALAKTVTGSLALFKNVRENVLTRDISNPGFSTQTGEQQTQGVELELAWDILPGWSARGGYAYQDAELIKSNDASVKRGNRIANIPEHVLVGFTKYEFLDGPLMGISLGGGFRYESERFGTNANTYSIGDYLTMDLTAGYKFSENFRGDLYVLNVFNENYILTGGSTTAIPGDPTMVYGRATVRF